MHHRHRVLLTLPARDSGTTSNLSASELGSASCGRICGRTDVLQLLRLLGHDMVTVCGSAVLVLVVHYVCSDAVAHIVVMACRNRGRVAGTTPTAGRFWSTAWTLVRWTRRRCARRLAWWSRSRSCSIARCLTTSRTARRLSRLWRATLMRCAGVPDPSAAVAGPCMPMRVGCNGPLEYRLFGALPACVGGALRCSGMICVGSAHVRNVVPCYVVGIQVARMAQAYDFIQEKDDKYMYKVRWRLETIGLAAVWASVTSHGYDRHCRVRMGQSCGSCSPADHVIHGGAGGAVWRPTVWRAEAARGDCA